MNTSAINPTIITQPAARRSEREQPVRNAELTVFALGKDQDAIVPALRLLGQFGRRELRRFQASLPCTMTLPAVYYDKVNAFVEALRASGTIFEIKSWSWVCPQEMADDHHWCNGSCTVQQIMETVT